MGGELRVLTFTAGTHDTQHWPADALKQAQASDDYGDWAFGQLADVMRIAGQAYIDANPGVFSPHLT